MLFLINRLYRIQSSDNSLILRRKGYSKEHQHDELYYRNGHIGDNCALHRDCYLCNNRLGYLPYSKCPKGMYLYIRQDQDALRNT